MNKELLKSKTFWTGILTGVIKIVNAFTNMIPPETEQVITEFALLAMGIFIRDKLANREKE